MRGGFYLAMRGGLRLAVRGRFYLAMRGGLRLAVRGRFHLVVVRGGLHLAVRGGFHLVILRGEFCLVVMRGGLITLNRLENLSLDMAIIKTQNRCQGIKSTMSMNIVNNLHNTS